MIGSLLSHKQKVDEVYEWFVLYLLYTGAFTILIAIILEGLKVAYEVWLILRFDWLVTDTEAPPLAMLV